MTSKTPVRSAEDVDEKALSYAEIKALAAGNPLIIEKTQLDTDVSKLKLLKQSYLSEIYRLEDMIAKYYPNRIKELEKEITNIEKDINLSISLTAMRNFRFAKQFHCLQNIKVLKVWKKLMNSYIIPMMYLKKKTIIIQWTACIFMLMEVII